MAMTSSRFRSRRRQAAVAALLASLCAAACSSGSAASQPQQLTLWSGTAAEFTNDLIQRFNSALPQTHIDLRTTSGGVVVVSAVDSGQGQLGLAQSDVVYLAYRRGIERQPVSAQEPARDRGAVGQQPLRAGPRRQPLPVDQGSEGPAASA